MPEAWPAPTIPALPGKGSAPRLYDSATADHVLARPDDETARLYVCGITPYDATHIGHANTYLAFDTMQRVWLDAGFHVHYTQNVTDVDDPLLERATATGVDWRDLAAGQIRLFRDDMTALRALPPKEYVAVTDVVDEIADAVATLIEAGVAYRVPTSDSEGEDIYFDNAAAARVAPWHLGAESNLTPDAMLGLFAERGGDPDRPDKHDALDPLLWRAARDGEPSWESPVGPGRPGWHIECSVIALKHLGTDFTVQGGGADLLFPHHEFSAGHAAALSGHPLAKIYSHAGLLSYQGAKISKSLGNLVLVSELLERGVPAGGIRLALLSHRYRDEWEWTDQVLADALQRLEEWNALRENPDGAVAIEVLTAVRDRLADDLDTPGALAVIDDAVAKGVDDTALLRDMVDALLGIDLAPRSAHVD